MDLSLDDQLSLWTGRIVRAEVRLESWLQATFDTLDSPGVGGSKPPKMLINTVKKLQQLIDDADLADDIRLDCLQVLAEVQRIHEDERNGIVHGWWVVSTDGERVATRQPLGVGPHSEEPTYKTVDEFAKTHASLEELVVRATGMDFTLSNILQDPWLAPRDSLLMREYLAGRFEIDNAGQPQITNQAAIDEYQGYLQGMLSGLIEQGIFRPKVE
jgi:hypothetical protein